MGFNWWVTSVLNSPDGQVRLAAWVIWVIVSITLHELAHGWAAIRKGDTTPIDAGHMTWNPIVHMGVPSLLIFALTGIAWGAMPVDPSRMRGKHADAFVSFAGPMMNFAIALVCIVIGGVVFALGQAGTSVGPIPAKTIDHLYLFFFVGACLNVALGVFNLFPLPPLDGSRILASFSRGYAEFVSSQMGQFASMVLFALAFFFAGRLVFGVGATVAGVGIGLLGAVLNAVGIGAPVSASP